MYCIKCGKKLPEDALYCNKCGARVPVDNTNSHTLELEPSEEIKGKSNSVPKVGNNYNKLGKFIQNHKKLIFFVLILCVSIVAFYCSVQFFSKNLSHQAASKYEHLQQTVDNEGQDSICVDSDDSLNGFITETEIKDIVDGFAYESNKVLPKNIAIGVELSRCEIEDKAILFVIEWNGLTKNDITNDFENDIRQATIEIFQAKEMAAFKTLLYQSFRYGYGFYTRLVDEDGNRLCDIRIPL